MDYLISASSDVGLVKKNNQDSLMAKVLSIDGENAALAVLCDGVGGLAKGELASATVVHAFDQWFVERFPAFYYSDNLRDQICTDWNRLLSICNKKIREYGNENNISLGTTVTAILLMKDQYYGINVGDSRIYQIVDRMTQITKDQTIVNYELEQGIITLEQAKTDARNNILLQCVGASEQLFPEFIMGKVCPGMAFMLCSDGFRHMVSDEEIYQRFRPDIMENAEVMKEKAIELIELNKSRMEKDNISVITIKTC